MAMGDFMTSEVFSSFSDSVIPCHAWDGSLQQSLMGEAAPHHSAVAPELLWCCVTFASVKCKLCVHFTD